MGFVFISIKRGITIIKRNGNYKQQLKEERKEREIKIIQRIANGD